MDIIDRVEIQHSVVSDFLASMFRLNNNQTIIEGYYELEFEQNIKLNEDILNWVKKSRKIIPPSIQEKFDVFFNKETFFGTCLICPASCMHINDVESFIKYTAELPCEDIIREFLNTGFGTGEEVDRSFVERLINDEKEAVIFIDSKLSIPSRQKWELLQFFLNPKRMKDDLVELLSWYYDNIYKNELEFIDEIIKKHEVQLEEKLRRFGSDYLKLLTGTDYSGSRSLNSVIISVSYFSELSVFSGSRNEFSKDIYVIGYRYPEILVKGKHTLLTGAQMFKALADETRLNIVKLLSKRPWYGHELAQKLNLSNSTVSYHLSMLEVNDFVKNVRVENRSYFKCDIENVKKILCDTLDKMVE